MTISWAYQLTEILACYFNTTLRIYVQKCWSSPNTVGWHQKINLYPNRWQNTWKELLPLGPRVLPLRQVILKGDNCSKHCIPIWNCTSMLPFSSVQSLSRVRLFATPWIAARQASLPITNSRSSLKLMSIESVMPSSHLILCHPLFLLPPIPPSIRVFSNESTLHMRWPKYWSFSFSIIPSKEHPVLISFRMDWLDLIVVVQGTHKSLLQHHSSKASILQYSAFFTVQPSHPYMTTGKTIALTKRTFVMSLLFNMLSRLGIFNESQSQTTVCWRGQAVTSTCSDVLRWPSAILA